MADTAKVSRDPVRTRLTLLEGATRAITSHGAGVSLETIAHEAGVSKGGLLHHFPTKDELLIALAQHVAQEFVDRVEATIDPGDDQPGRLVRAYIRAVLDDLDLAENIRNEATLMAALGSIPEVMRRAQESGRRWKAAFAADGLDPQRAALITRSADGTAAAALFEGQLDLAEVDEMRNLLMAMSRNAGPPV